MILKYNVVMEFLTYLLFLANVIKNLIEDKKLKIDRR